MVHTFLLSIPGYIFTSQHGPAAPLHCPFCLEHISESSILHPFVSDYHEVHIADASCHDMKELAGLHQ